MYVMSFWDWLVVLIPLALILGAAFYCRTFIRSVSDYLVAGRVAGRYAVAVAGMESALGVITLVGYVENHYQTGFSMMFWSIMSMPLTMFLSLSGFCLYRYRETKAMSLGQFLEIRYSKSLRIFAMSLRTFSEILTNIICPALAARFFIYLMGLPLTFNILGRECSTYTLAVLIVLGIAVLVPLTGGSIALIVTDCIQGLLCYPIFLILVIFVFTEFSWFDEIAPTMLHRVPTESFLNPYDVSGLRDFNVFALIVGMFAHVLNRANWYGNGATSAAKTPHESKMSSVLGTWRGGLSAIMQVLIAVCIITVMGHPDFAFKAKDIRMELSENVSQELVENPEIRQQMKKAFVEIPPDVSKEKGHDALKSFPKHSRKKNFDTPYFDAAEKVLKEHHIDKVQKQTNGKKNSLVQQFKTLYHQNMLAVAMKHILPAGLIGMFVLLGMMLMISTDAGRMFSSAVTLVQDLIVPLRSKPFTQKQQVTIIRWFTVIVALVFFIGSQYLSHLDFVQLFVIICVSIWSGGAGSVMVFGLYSRFGTTAGAFASLITGLFISGGGFLVQRNWADYICPWLIKIGAYDGFGKFLSAASRPFNPYIVWEINEKKFPINSQEFYFIAMVTSVAAYCIVSLITYRKPFNLDRMLYRGKYNIDGVKKNIHTDWSFRTVFKKIIGINPDYTKGDRIIAWSVFCYTFIYRFLIATICVAIWNSVSPWQPHWWSCYFFVTLLAVPGVAGVITTVWFIIGGSHDLYRLFVDLNKRKQEAVDEDNGRVSGNMSEVDRKKLEAIAAAKSQDSENK